MNPTWNHEMPRLMGPWMGQGLPQNGPTKFCPEVLATENPVCGITFSPAGDEAYFTWNRISANSADLMTTRMKNGVWMRPKSAFVNSDQIDNDITLSPDGKRLCWRSWRPLPGSSEPEEGSHLWAADRQDGAWSEAFPIRCDGAVQTGWYPSFARKGALYFSARSSEGTYKVVRAQRTEDQYGAVETLIDGMGSGGDICVHPEERFLIVTRFSLPRFQGIGNLTISFPQSDGVWTPLKELGPAINTEKLEYCATISADGEKLFFCRMDRSTRRAQTYWVSASSIVHVGA